MLKKEKNENKNKNNNNNKNDINIINKDIDININKNKPNEEVIEANEINDNPEEVEVVILSRGKRCIVFILFMTMNIIINMDNGTVPALIDQIAIQLDIQKEIIGLFGSLQYGGNLIGN
jgi:hypothetical protein